MTEKEPQRAHLFRWQAIITYRTERGPIDVPHDLSELDELQDLVEAGPHFGAI